MAHDHHHDHHESIKNIKVAFFLNIGFTLVEIVGGILTNSVAILSDALHDFGDSLTLGLSWYFQKLSQKGRDEKFSYGYRRFSMLGAIINALVLLAGSLIILFETVPRLFDPEQPNAEGMIYLAIGGVLVNGLAALRLRKGHSLNEKVVSLHLLEDVLGWVAVLIGSIVMTLTYLPILDPLLSIGIVLFVLFNVYRNLKKAMLIIMQSVPDDIDIDRIKVKLLSLAEVLDVHDIHAWKLATHYNVMTMHVQVEGTTTMSQADELKTKIKQLLKEEDIQHLTIEVELQHEEVMGEE